MARSVLFGTLSLLLLSACSAAARSSLAGIPEDILSRVRGWHTGSSLGEEGDFALGELQEVIKGSGGSFSIWNKDHPIFQDTDVQAGFLRLESQGLLLPSYTDSQQVHYVIRGAGRAGLVTPLGVPAGIRHLDAGDLLVHPRGWTLWIWNNGGSPLEILSVSDTQRSTEREGKRAARAEQTHFWLAGAEEAENGGILHGFTEELLSQAWDVDVKDVKALREGQKETAIIAVSKDQVPALEASVESFAREHRNSFFGDFVFNLEEREKDVEDPKAGWLAVMNGWKSRIVRKVGIATARLHLEPNALTAPRWVGNTAVLYYAIKGQLHVEAVYPDGKPALDREVKAGEAIAIPAGYARASIASSEGFEGVAFSLETSRPMGGFLAGGNSVFRGIPHNIQRHAFGVGDDVIDEFAKSRREEYIIFRPAGESPKGVGEKGAANLEFMYPRGGTDVEENGGDMGLEGLAFF